MSKEKISGIYKITNLVNGKMYIGQSIDIYKRWKEHKATSLNKESQAYNYPIYCAFRKYGFENFKFEVIEECSTDKLDEKEIYYIEKYNTFTLWENSNGYNQTIGGSGTKGIISRGAKTICEGNIFNTIKECAEYYNVDFTNMHNWLYKTGYMPKKWYDKGLRYDNESITDYNYTIRKSKKKVICNNIIYEKIKDLCEEYNISQSTVNCWLKGKRTMPQKFIDLGLKYYTDEIN